MDNTTTGCRSDSVTFPSLPTPLFPQFPLPHQSPLFDEFLNRRRWRKQIGIQSAPHMRVAERLYRTSVKNLAVPCHKQMPRQVFSLRVMLQYVPDSLCTSGV
jgi:hypothetical protein